MDFSRIFNLNNRQLLYTYKTTGNYMFNYEKKLVEMPQGRDFANRITPYPIITVKMFNNGAKYEYINRQTLESVTAKRTDPDTFNVSIPSKDGDKYIGYIKNNEPISWSKNKNLKKLLKKMSQIIKNGYENDLGNAG